jgi:ankyrin repeat protein
MAARCARLAAAPRVRLRLRLRASPCVSLTPRFPLAARSGPALPLLTLARDNLAAEIRAAVAAGADVNAGNAIAQRALHIAALHGNLDAMAALLDCGADPNLANERNQTPLVRAARHACMCMRPCACAEPRAACVRLQHFAVSAKKGNALAACELLVKRGADPMARLPCRRRSLLSHRAYRTRDGSRDAAPHPAPPSLAPRLRSSAQHATDRTPYMCTPLRGVSP